MTTTITISNPTPYTKSVNTEFGVETTPMIRFIVTGSPEAVAQYYKDHCDDLARQGKEPAQKDDKGNPLMHFLKATAVKYGEEAVLTRDVNDKGQAIYFMAEDSTKELNEMIAGASAITQRVFAEKELDNLIALSKSYAKNRSTNRANYIAKLRTTEDADLNKI
jgi:hypothetical protein